MTNLNRRRFITGLGLICAPAIVPYKALMPVKLFEPEILVSPGVSVWEWDTSGYTIIDKDLKAIHGLDVEAELSQILSEQIRQQIDQEVIKTLYFGIGPPHIYKHSYPRYPYSFLTDSA